MHSESDTRAKFIDPALRASGWSDSQVTREHYFTDGRIFTGGRGKRKYVDYLLRHRGKSLAIIEAKKFSLGPTEWLEQVKEYGRILAVRFVYSTNGQKIYELDLESGRGKYVETYPTPDELYSHTVTNADTAISSVMGEPYHVSEKKPRYYQDIAIRRTLEAMGAGQDRVLLTLATGTGKTYIAFQLAYKLFQSRWSRDGVGKRRPRILFLADRNVLVGQAMNDFNPLEKSCIKIDGDEIRRRRWIVPTNANIFFAIYQALAGGASEENPEDILEAYYDRYDPDFFDLIIIDECHRGGAKKDGNWAEILKHFSGAVHLGMTATPKRDDNIDTYEYFGKPVYEYSLAQGIEDGFLTPFKIKRIRLNIDELALTSGDRIVSGEVTKSVYTTPDFERSIMVDERNYLIAKSIIENIRPMDKTIVFCVDQDHAARMRDAINTVKTMEDADYCVRVTSNEGAIGRGYLERFQDNGKTIPVILTSSQMLTTGVDARNVRNIVLVRDIGSIVEYKQIIGRGTRLYDDKDFFTILDFVGATNRFLDEVWDGAADIVEWGTGTTPVDTPPVWPTGPTTPPPPRPERLVVELDKGRELRVMDIETRYIDPETGKLLSARDFLMKLVGTLPALYRDEAQLRQAWANPERREELLSRLAERGIGPDQLEDLRSMFGAQDSDIFDVLAHISYGTDMLSRSDRRHIAEPILAEYGTDMARDFVDFLLSLYVREGILGFRRGGLSDKIRLFGRGTTSEIAAAFGGNKDAVRAAYYRVQESLYVK